MLLGEPGIGKSYSIKSEFDSVEKTAKEQGEEALFYDLRIFGSEDRFVRSVFDGAEIQRWAAGNTILHLFLDSMDEGLLRITTLAALIGAELERMPIERLRVRITCRTGDWPSTLETSLMSLWPNGQVGIYELLPLRKVDVTTAAEDNNLGATRFLDEVAAKGAVPLAIKPITLTMLLQRFSRDSALPSNRARLYELGCRALCEESRARREGGLGGNLSADQRLQVASRIAAVTVFGNRFAVWTGGEFDDIPPEDVVMRQVAGGVEGAEGGSFDVDEPAIRESLGTGLFSSRALHQVGWAHQTYAEFLAARYLNEHGLQLAQILSPIRSP